MNIGAAGSELSHGFLALEDASEAIRDSPPASLARYGTRASTRIRADGSATGVITEGGVTAVTDR